MKTFIGAFTFAAAALAAVLAWKKTREPKEVIVENLRYRGAY